MRVLRVFGQTLFSLPIVAEAPGNPTQNVAGQGFDADPGQNEEPRVIGDQMQVLGSPWAVPTDIVVPGGTLPSRRAKEQASQRPSLGVADQILQVFPDAAAVA